MMKIIKDLLIERKRNLAFIYASVKFYRVVYSFTVFYTKEGR